MFDLNQAIKDWRKSLRRNASLEDGYIMELESHLRDEIENLSGQGISIQEAFHTAVKNIGESHDLGAEYYKTDTRSFIGQPPWKMSRWNPGLYWNYLKLALRKLRRQKGFSFINVTGLAVGMACCILILLWVTDELNYDRFHENADRIYRVISENHAGGKIMLAGESPSLIGPTLVEEYPEVVNFTRVQCGWTGYYLHYGEKNFMWERLCTADPSFFEIFKFTFLQGDPKTALKDRGSIVLTETLAKKAFGDEDPMGKVMKISSADFKVTGVIKDPPHNSQIQFDYAFPVINMTKFRSSKLDTWTYTQFTTYVELAEKVDAQDFSNRISGIVKKNLPESKVNVFFQPLTRGHLHSSHINNWTIVYPNPGNITYVYIFTLTAFCILLLACINFMNLTTARSGTRAKEIGMRKVAGAHRKELIKQFMGESTLLSFLALMMAILLVELVRPAFNVLAGKQITLDFTGNQFLFLGLFGIALVTGIISGSYPALFLSAFQPVAVLKAAGQGSVHRGGRMRKTLVVVQFAFTIILITISVVIYSQLHFIQNKDLGYDKDNIITFASYGKYGKSFAATREELLQNPNILSLSRAFPPSGGLRETTDVDWEGKDPAAEIMIYTDMGDYDFRKTFGIEMAEGRFYSREFTTDLDNFVINETAAHLMGPGSPLGKRFRLRDKTGIIIGVVKDYHGGSLHSPIMPKVIRCSPEGGFFVCVKFAGSTSEMLSFLEQKWKKFVPGYPFRYDFVSDSISEYYNSERKIGKIFRYFTGLAIFIACLGLFGLASFTAEQRTKEIGIRKVLGAKVMGIILLLSKEFTKWVLVANLIAWPVSYYIASQWLQSFAYRIPLGWEILVLSSLAALLVALLTVSYQSLRAASANPVESLRYE